MTKDLLVQTILNTFANVASVSPDEITVEKYDKELSQILMLIVGAGFDFNVHSAAMKASTDFAFRQGVRDA